MGLQCLGLIAQDFKPDIDDLVRGATPIQVPKRLQSSEGVDAVAEHPGTRLRGEERPEKFGGATRLAFLLCVSPTSKPEWFRSQVEKFPSLGSKISPVWIQPWSEDALVEVAQTSLMWEIRTHTTQDIAESMEVVAAQMAASVSGAGHALSGGAGQYISAVLAARQFFKEQQDRSGPNAGGSNMDRMGRDGGRDPTPEFGMVELLMKESDNMVLEFVKEIEEYAARNMEAEDGGAEPTLSAEAREGGAVEDSVECETEP
eukprot:g10274.t1